MSITELLISNIKVETNIPVHLDMNHDDEFIAYFDDIDIYEIGNTEEEAIEKLKKRIVETYSKLNLLKKEKSLLYKDIKQLEILDYYIKKRK